MLDLALAYRTTQRRKVVKGIWFMSWEKTYWPCGMAGILAGNGSRKDEGGIFGIRDQLKNANLFANSER